MILILQGHWTFLKTPWRLHPPTSGARAPSVLPWCLLKTNPHFCGSKNRKVLSGNWQNLNEEENHAGKNLYCICELSVNFSQQSLPKRLMSVILAVGPAILRCYASYWHKNADSILSIGTAPVKGGILQSPTLNSESWLWFDPVLISTLNILGISQFAHYDTAT